MRVLSIASNEDWFKLCQSYRVETQGIAFKYKSVVAKWHKKSIAHRANGVPYNAPKPASAHHQSQGADNFDRNVKETGKRVGKFFDDLFK